MFVQDQWYVIAAAHELQSKPLGRLICNEPIVIYRRGDGSVAALQDCCAHRKAPLSAGEVVGDDIQCGYHGLRFDGHGLCTFVPSSPDKPRPGTLRVPAYPVLERHGLIFLWIGDGSKADVALLPDLGANTASGWTAVHGYHHLRCNYQLLIDNLLDSTHLDYVHKSTLAGGGVDAPLEVDIAGDLVRTRRVIRNSEPTAFHVATTGKSGNIDRFQFAEFRAPIYIVLTIGAEPAGRFAEMQKPNRLVINSCTPETECTTHYFWSVTRSFALDDRQVSDTIREMTRTAFDEDAAMLAAQQRAIETDKTGKPFVTLAGDRAAAAARRIIARKLKQREQPVAAV